MSGPRRLVVTRSPERDVAEWVGAGSGPRGGAAPVPPGAEQAPELAGSTGSSHADVADTAGEAWRRPSPPALPSAGPVFVGRGRPAHLLFGLLAVFLVFGLLAIFLAPGKPKPIEAPLIATIADLAPVHAGVTVKNTSSPSLPSGSELAREVRRLAVDDVVETDADGRARLRLDTGSNVVIDGATKLAITDKGFKLEAGRVFVTATNGPPTVIDLGDGGVTLVGSTAGIERRGATKVYASSGEIVARAGGRESVVRTGETATFEGGKVSVAPERGFDDWTGGLAAPWAASGAPRRAVGEIWGRAAPGQAGSPLTIRTHEVRATIYGEVAESRVRTTFFNAGDQTVLGDYRMGLPPGAVVASFASTRGDMRREGRLSLAKRGVFAPFETSSGGGGGDVLEWAGDGWVRGVLPQIPPGQTVTVDIVYVEWLSPRAKGDDKHVVQYRYPLAGEGDGPLVGEFFAQVEAGPSGASELAAGFGARASGTSVEVRRADFRPSADFVVDVEIPRSVERARAFIADPIKQGEEPTIVVRTEAPRLAGKGEEGVTLAIVLDASSSVDPALFDASRAFIEALVKSLGHKDQVVVLASDATVRPVGPAKAAAADEAHKQAIIEGLGQVTLGGATDMGRAFETAADALPPTSSSGMVVYVGDGWPSVGDRTPEAIRARLARRARGVPRLGAVLVGPSANRLAMASLVRGSGPLVEIGDTEEAARASVELLESALVPTVTGVSIDLGPSVTRVYPRADFAAPQGSTITVVGKLAAEPPSKIQIAYREGAERKSEVRAITATPSTHQDDVRRRWAVARVESLALAGRGREAITDAALGAGLLTPWTAFSTQGAPDYLATPLETRVLDLSAGGAGGMPLSLEALDGPHGALAGDSDVIDNSNVGLEQALMDAAIRAIEESRAPLRACRDSRAALRPDLPPAIQIELKIDGDGKVTKSAVYGANDEALTRCVTTVLENLPYPKLGLKAVVTVNHTVRWPPPESLRGKKCSPTSTLALPLRRGVWRERIDRVGHAEAYLEARRGCELASWTAKRSMLELMLTTLEQTAKAGSSLQSIGIASTLEDAGDAEASAFLRREALRRATPQVMRSVRFTLLARERLPVGAFLAEYEKAKDDRARLGVVRKFLELAPHDTRLRARLMALLESLGEKDALVEEVRRVRIDPYADGTLLADAARALRRAGLEDEARRTFGEIAEHGARDPWALALLGDRLRSEGWFDDASAVYAALENLVPDDASTLLRVALAHAGAGRLDVALRILGRVGRTGGRAGSPDLAVLAERAAHMLVQAELGREGLTANDRASLERVSAEMPRLPHGTTIVIKSPPGRTPISAWVERGPDDARDIVRPEATAGRVGLLSLRLEPGDTSRVVLSLARDKGLVPDEPVRVSIDMLTGDERTTFDFELPVSGERKELVWSGGSFSEAPPRKAP